MKLKDRILAILFPPKCIFCRKVLDHDGVCKECMEKLPFRTHAKIKPPMEFVDALYSPLYYEGNVRSAVLRYKFGGLKAYAIEFAKILADCIEDDLTGKYDCITWVPVSRSRLRKRGYDQAQLLAEELGNILGMRPMKLLRKARDVQPQSRQSTKEKRTANINGAFVAREENLQGKRVLLIDDIATTGATLSECARVLKCAGVQQVYALVLAKTRLMQKKN